MSGKRKKRAASQRRYEFLASHPVYGDSKWRKLKRFVNKFFGKLCLRCGTKTGQFHADHVIPWRMNQDRSFDPTNLQQLCARCNSWKGNRYMEFRVYVPSKEDLVRYNVAHLVPGFKEEMSEKQKQKVRADDAANVIIRIRNGLRITIRK